MHARTRDVAGFIEIVAPHMTLVKVDAGDYVVTEGERGTDIFFVLAGTVHCEYETDDRTRHTLMKYSAGQYFGDVAMFILEKNIVSYKVTEVGKTQTGQTTASKCELYMLPRYVLLQLAFETKGGEARNHGEVKHEMQLLAHEKLRLLSQQIDKLNRWAAEEAERKLTEPEQQVQAVTEAIDARPGGAPPSLQRGRVLSRVLDAADAEATTMKTMLETSSPDGGEPR